MRKKNSNQNGVNEDCLKHLDSLSVVEKFSEKELEEAREALKNSPKVEVRQGFPSTAYHDRKEYKERHND